MLSPSEACGKEKVPGKRFMKSGQRNRAHVTIIQMKRILIVLWAVAWTAANAAEISTPDFARVRYDQATDCLVLNESLGDADHIREIAAKLKGKTDTESLIAIHRWVNENLKYDANAAYEYRDFDQAVAKCVYGGCADYAVVYTSLARACGIPTVFVKTMDVDWIYEFTRAGKCENWRGHVYLEVFVDGKWKLLEPGGNTLYDQYDVTQHLMPGGTRWAYDKGIDPKQIILSPDWENWKIQTAAHFRDFDVRQLPPADDGRRLGTVYVTANSPVWQMIDAKVRKSGLNCYSFNTQFEKFIPMSRGGQLIITCVGDKLILPEDQRNALLPMDTAKIKAELDKEPAGIARRTLDDGTHVTLLYARDVKAIEKLLETWELEPKQ
jgi:transglutaminase-like putative cysteine protease